MEEFLFLLKCKGCEKTFQSIKEAFCHVCSEQEEAELPASDNTPKATICPKCGGKTTVRPFGDGTFKCFACFHIW